ncbi:protein-lysine N-methyltransferase SMYD4 [Chanos chanos]|uniref:Protein-lysine N-methyltransferase SMYD4 n=1 Tax=Chanos chanos TaxID=29144 RepID=A0A6J2WXA1_CHACN|nr:SET and MYND domain-containing protein 4 [Chanos chanos]
MDLPCPKWMKHVEQKWTGLSAETRQSFTVLDKTDEMFQFGLSQINQEDLEILTDVSGDYGAQKSPESAGRFREQGNRSFKARDYAAAALLYSKGICHATKGTEQLALCYANRSAALFYLSLYKECLADICRALDEGYPGHLRHKLSERRTQCLNRLREQGRDPEVNGTENVLVNTDFQTAQGEEGADAVSYVSPDVSVCLNPGKGRHLLARVEKPAGEVVLEDTAYSSVLIPGEGRCTEGERTKRTAFGTEDRHCHHCLSHSLNPIPCASCSYARYCGERCQREAWQQYHCWDCPIGSELLALGVLAHLSLRVALKAGLKEVQKARGNAVTPKNDVHEPTKENFLNEDKDGGEGLSTKFPSGQKSPASEVPFGGNSLSVTCSQCHDHSSCYHESYLGVYSLLPHVTKQAPSLRFLLAVTMGVLYQRLQKVGPPPASWDSTGQGGGWAPEMTMLGATALRHMMQLRCNAQAVRTVRVSDETGSSVQSSQEIRVATAIFPVLSLLNHSCSPNTSLTFTTDLPSEPSKTTDSDGPETKSVISHTSPGIRVVVRTSRDVAAGQELLHCYGPHYSRMEVWERQHLLQEQYFFHCQCQACQRETGSSSKTQEPAAARGFKCSKCEGPLQSDGDGSLCLRSSCGHFVSKTDMEWRLQSIRHHLDRGVQSLEMDRADEALGILKEASAQADSILERTHPLQGELADTVARAYATMGDWSRAAVHLRRSVEAVRSQYGENSVELGRQLFKLAQLHFNGGDAGSAMSVIPAARCSLSLHCGPRCEELQELQAMEDCLRGVL